MKSIILPAGFVELRLPQYIWWVKIGWEQLVTTNLHPSRTFFTTAPLLTPIGGRGSLHQLRLGDGGSAIIRRYHRGGLIRYFTHELYWERPFRPLAELVCTEIARQRKIPTIEVLAAGIEQVALGLYRGFFISREAHNFVNFWEWLRNPSSQSKRHQIIENVARAIAHLHSVGIYHPDLNLTNILVSPLTLQPQSLIIDFDRARILKGPLSPSQRKRNLQRLRRSLHKLDPSKQFSSQADLEIFCRAYHAQFSVLTSHPVAKE